MDGWPPACSSASVLLPARMTTTARTNFCHQGPLSLKVDGRLSELWIMVMRMRTTTMLTVVVTVKMNVTIATMAMTVLYVAVTAQSPRV